MRHLVIIESPATGAGIRLIELALEDGYRVTLYTMRAELFQSRLQHINFEAIQADIYADDLVAMIRARVTPDEHLGIVSTYDRCLVRWAELAAMLGVPGPSIEAMRRCASKIEQNEHLRRHGLRRAESTQVLPAELPQGRVFNELRYPIVVKPENGFASTGVRLCHGLPEVHAHLGLLNALRGSSLDTLDLGAILLESFVDGPEYCVEMYDGEFVGIVRKYCIDAHSEFLEAGYACVPFWPDDLIVALRGAASDAVEALGVDRGPVHIDVKMSVEGPYVLEVNPRVAGGVISELIRHTYGFDFVRALLSSAFGESTPGTGLQASGRATAAGFIGSWEIEAGVEVPNWSYSIGDTHIEYKSQIVPSRARAGVIHVAVADHVDPWETFTAAKQRLLVELGAGSNAAPELAGNWAY
jgi:biotin carboxylase